MLNDENSDSEIETTQDKENNETEIINEEKDDYPSNDLDIYEYDTCKKDLLIKESSPFTAHFDQLFNKALGKIS